MVLAVPDAERAKESAERFLSRAGGLPLSRGCHYGASMGDIGGEGGAMLFVRRWLPAHALQDARSKLLELGELRYFEKIGEVGNVDDALAEAHQTLQHELRAHAADLKDSPWVLSLARATVARLEPSAVAHRQTKGMVFLNLQVVE